MQTFRHSVPVSIKRASLSKIPKFSRGFESGSWVENSSLALGKSKEKKLPTKEEVDSPYTTTAKPPKLSAPDGRRYALPRPNTLGIGGANNPPSRIMQALKYYLSPVESPQFSLNAADVDLVVSGVTKLGVVTYEEWDKAFKSLEKKVKYRFRVEFLQPLQQFGIVDHPIVGYSTPFQFLDEAMLWASAKLLYLIHMVFDLKHGQKVIIHELKVEGRFVVGFENPIASLRDGIWKTARLSLNDERGFWCFDLHKIRGGEEMGDWNLERMSVKIDLWKEYPDFEVAHEGSGVCDTLIITMSDNITDQAFEAPEKYHKVLGKQRSKLKKLIVPATVKRKVDGSPERWVPIGNHLFLECEKLREPYLRRLLVLLRNGLGTEPRYLNIRMEDLC
ncbi:hypothetical protein BGZ60DRAFT_426012 [Tricladium varicosporioides]|nr:hypothetical protein BGZ60DRAFT_426012 [Hymenoscyphus varicosporioides]